MKPVAFYYRNDRGAFLMITHVDADGRVTSSVTNPVSGKADAIAHARAIGARFTC